MSDEKPQSIEARVHLNWPSCTLIFALLFCMCTHTCGNFHAGSVEVGCAAGSERGE